MTANELLNAIEYHPDFQGEEHREDSEVIIRLTDTNNTTSLEGEDLTINKVYVDTERNVWVFTLCPLRAPSHVR